MEKSIYEKNKKKNKVFFYKNRVIRTATKGQKQAHDLQRIALTSLVHFVV